MEDKNNNKTTGNSSEKSGVSRRKWLIDVGKAAALAGIAGNAAPFDAEALGESAAAESRAQTLPPGLYRPSFDHLGSALGNDSRFHSIPPGCQVDFIRPRSGPFEPQFFSPEEYEVIHHLTAMMLGEPSAVPGEETLSPDGNIVDEVAEWIDLRTYSFAGVRQAAQRLTPEQVALARAYDGAPLLRRVKATDPQKTYRNGLAWMAEESERRYQRAFIQLSVEQQTAMLDLISDDHAGKNVENDGTRFFRQLKNDIISGFYTSRTGLKELDDKANRFYAESPGCPSSTAGGPKPEH